MRYDNNDGLFFNVYLLLAVTIGGMNLWLGLIRVSGTAMASKYHLLNPFFGVLLAYLILCGAFTHGGFHWRSGYCNLTNF
ncbi:hypothetical protein [Halomonas sp. KO116]|uniref:hypothetical protein n=1 Tax=Halomonas sp. KO116 TaxID=1504981 RepID=UPI0005573DD8|nr:hypothetical protein [Halomonas sp. KO116]